MDWKDHIIADNCNEQAKAFIPFATEAFLVTLANKGLFKRSLKDLEVTDNIKLSAAGDKIHVILDDISVSLDTNISLSTCSCLSKTICKHVLMAILATAEYAAGISSKQSEEITETSPLEEPWKEIKQIDITILRKQAGKKLFEDTLRLIQDGWTADFEEKDMLEAIINTENISVYFPRRNSISNAVCKCGDAGLCKHKLIAILSYLSNQGLLNESCEETAISLITEETNALLSAAGKFVVSILDKGIITCGENESETAIQYSVKMETCGIGNLAGMFRSLSSDLDNMLAKHIGFNQLNTFAILSRLDNTIRMILKNTNNNQMLGQLIESTRSDYYTTPIGTFTGLGVSPWQTRSGYFGMTVYFFYHEKQTICTYTVSMADYYSKTEELATTENLLRQYQRNEHWANSFSLATLSQSTFTLRNFKMNRQNRLSSSNQTQCEITGKVNRQEIETIQASSKLFDLAENIDSHYSYFSKRQPEQIILIPFTDLINVSFDHTDQRLYFSFFHENIVANGSLDYNDFNKGAIQLFEKMGRRTENKPRMMVCMKRSDRLLPVSIIDDKGVNNFFFTSGYN